MKVLVDFLNLRRVLNHYINKHDYISFDVFDTLIKRKCGNPHNVFDLVEAKYNDIYRERISNFRHLRIECESKARQNKGETEITLNDIYDVMSEFLGHHNANLLKKTELMIELEQCIAREEIVNVYKNTLLCKNVIITSDMYLPQDVINGILIKNNIPLPNYLFVSCDMGMTKRKGSLFRYISNSLNLKGSQILHIGDNVVSDYLQPKMCGWHSFLVDK